jgi:hypothetical protein
MLSHMPCACIITQSISVYADPCCCCLYLDDDAIVCIVTALTNIDDATSAHVAHATTSKAIVFCRIILYGHATRMCLHVYAFS